MVIEDAQNALAGSLRVPIKLWWREQTSASLSGQGAIAEKGSAGSSFAAAAG